MRESFCKKKKTSLEDIIFSVDETVQILVVKNGKN
jgi:hypothetical protein